MSSSRSSRRPDVEAPLPAGATALVDALEEAALLVDAAGRLAHANDAAVARWGPLRAGLGPAELAAALDSDAVGLGQLAGAAGERGVPAPFSLARLEGSAAPVPGLDGLVLLRFAATSTGAPRSAMVAELAARVELLAEASRRRRAELVAAEALHSTVVDVMHDGLVVQDPTGAIIDSNAAARRVLGLGADDLHGRSSDDGSWVIVDADGAPWDPSTFPSMRTLRTGEAVRDERMGVERPDGTLLWLDVSTQLLPDGGGVFTTFVDVTERLVRQRELQAARERLRQAFQEAPTGVALCALDGRWLQTNGALCELLGRSEEQLLEMTWQQLTHPDDLDADSTFVQDLLDGRRRSYTLEKRYVRADGVAVWVELAVSLVRHADGSPDCLIAHVQDISERRMHEFELRRLAEHDALTGLVNRRRFSDELARELSRVRRGGATASLLLLDLDRFKRINDTYGHAVGDDVIRGVAACLRRRLRASDVIARLGGDEFAVLLPDTGAAQAERVADSLLARIRAVEVVAGDEVVRPTGSVGVVELDPASSGPSDDLVLADLAMYAAKSAGRDRSAGARPDRLAPDLDAV